MNRTCIIVADAKIARFYGVEETESPRVKMKLVERTVLANPNSDKAEEKELEHHNMPATSATPTDPDGVAGKQAFESKCLACHSVGQGKKLGPDIYGVTKMGSDDWLTKWLKAPEKMLETDPIAKAMPKEYNNIPMTNQNLSDVEIRQYIKYFHWIDSQPAGAVAAGGGGH